MASKIGEIYIYTDKHTDRHNVIKVFSKFIAVDFVISFIMRAHAKNTSSHSGVWLHIFHSFHIHYFSCPNFYCLCFFPDERTMLTASGSLFVQSYAWVTWWHLTVSRFLLSSSSSFAPSSSASKEDSAPHAALPLVVGKTTTGHQYLYLEMVNMRWVECISSLDGLLIPA